MRNFGIWIANVKNVKTIEDFLMAGMFLTVSYFLPSSYHLHEDTTYLDVSVHITIAERNQWHSERLPYRVQSVFNYLSHSRYKYYFMAKLEDVHRQIDL